MALTRQEKQPATRRGWPRRFIPLASLFMVSGVLALLIPGFFREVIFVPLLDLLFTLYRFYKGLPQNVVWVVFLTVALLAAGRALWPQQQPLPVADDDLPAGGRVQQLVTLTAAARRSDYAQWQLVRELVNLTESLLIRQYGERDLSLYQRIEQGEITVLPKLKRLLQVGAALPNYRVFIESRDAAVGQTMPLLADLDLAAILQALQQLDQSSDWSE